MAVILILSQYNFSGLLNTKQIDVVLFLCLEQLNKLSIIGTFDS